MADMPSGTVTFLFTDIEGSTKLWERCPDAMRLALARHDEVLRQAIARHGGYVFKTVGDAFCASFPTAPDALNAALDAHLDLQAQEWGETGPIRVRMGLHTGEAEERDNDYFGQALNRTARLQAVGYGQHDVQQFDPDLAGQIAVTRERGVRLQGIPIAEIITVVPQDTLQECFFSECEWALERIAANPVYGILNPCRVLAYFSESSLLSKEEGEWARERLPEPYRTIVAQTLTAYRGIEGSDSFDIADLHQFAAYIPDCVRYTTKAEHTSLVDQFARDSIIVP